MLTLNRTVLVIVLANIAIAVNAQTFSAEQQAVIDQVRRCNDGWTAAVAGRDFERFADACPHDADALWWYTDTDQPGTFAQVFAFSSGQAARNQWRDFVPVSVRIDGDHAFVYYEITWQPTTADGETRTAPSRRFTAMRRDGGVWVQIGGSIAPIRPTPASDTSTPASQD
jgi:ketosteroid isomerase-like protein